MDAGGLRQVAGIAVLGRHGEHVAAGAEDGPLPVGRDVVAGDFLADVFQSAAPGRQVLVQVDGHLLRLLRRQVEAINESAVLEDDRLIAQRRELDVVILEVRKLAGGLRLQVVDEQVHPLVLVAVGEEIDLVAAPHGKDVAGRVVA